MLSAIVLFGLSCLFGGYGIFTLVAAYRAGDLAVWGRLVVLAGMGVLLGAVLGRAAIRLILEVLQQS
jgi:hypothetical protein